jgi:hypothetical protein
MQKAWLCTAKTQHSLAHWTVSGGAPDSVRCARLNTGKQVALGRSLAAYGYNSLDCPVCTGQCPVSQDDHCSNGQLCQLWKEIRHRTGYSTCPVVHQTVRCATRQKANIAFQMKSNGS